MPICTSVSQLIGHTPLLEITNIEKKDQLHARVLVKLESFNPAGSIKDRVALAMILDAEEKGILKPGSTIIEPTSGNTGIGLCSVAAARGYQCVIIMPDSMSMERRMMMKALGAKLVLTPGKEGMSGAIAKAKLLASEIQDSWIAGQFINIANPMIHYKTTGPEIWNDTEGKIDIFVAGIGTGGTISGIGKYLKEKKEWIQIIGVEPFDSPLITEGHSGSHGIQGIGANFIPDILDLNIIDQVIPVKTEEAYMAARRMGKEEGILCGISSGAALHVALELAKDPENKGKTIVTILPDSGERYLSTPLYDFE
ncbi:MAG: cysteine synthase A [Erysipelotrichaceae bacterium]|nr:cysteine synthase A [Erysipelotrichaceae bacterium]